jgi:hypothetical protein
LGLEDRTLGLDEDRTEEFDKGLVEDEIKLGFSFEIFSFKLMITSMRYCLLIW